MAKVPLYYVPRPYQEDAWMRRFSGRYHYYIKLWHRQAGKDTDDIQFCLTSAYLNPGTQSVYAGPNNRWLRANIFNKYLDGRTHFQQFPPTEINVNSTLSLVTMLNNPEDLAPASVQYVGVKEAEALIGSSYDKFFFSELSLYNRGTLDYLQPIWDNKLANGLPLLVNCNFTPRGLSNIAADWLTAWTGTDDPEGWPGPHGDVYVDWLPAYMSVKSDGSRLYSDEDLEKIRDRYIRLYGNDNLFRQEMLCEFLAVNAGLVFPAIEILRKENRYHSFNLDTSKPVYLAMDISSKGKETDWTTAIVFQVINGQMFIYDYLEVNRLAVVEAVQELAKRDYFHLIRAAFLPWDSDRSGSMHSPLEECRAAFPNVDWHKLERMYKVDGIANGRRVMQNLHINSDKNEWVMQCFENWEYKTIESLDDFAAEPKHDRYSHTMDSYIYACNAQKQFPWIFREAGHAREMPSFYGSWKEQGSDEDWDDWPVGMRPRKGSPLRKKGPNALYGHQTEGGLWVAERGL